MGSPALNGRNNGQRLGITDPISLSGPTEYDVIKTRELEKVLDYFHLSSIIYCKYAVFSPEFGCLFLFWSVQYLQDAGLYESQEEAVSREEVLGRLDQVGSPLVAFEM